MKIGINCYSNLRYYGIINFDYVIHFEVLSEKRILQENFPIKRITFNGMEFNIPPVEYVPCNFKAFELFINAIGYIIESSTALIPFVIFVRKIIAQLISVPRLEIYYTDITNKLIKYDPANFRPSPTTNEITLMIRYVPNNLRRFVTLINDVTKTFLEFSIITIVYIKYNNFVHDYRMGLYSLATRGTTFDDMIKLLPITYYQNDNDYWYVYKLPVTLNINHQQN